MNTKEKPKEQKQRERIIRAAAKALTRKGYSDVTVDEFAQAMKSTKGTIYYYFPSKADILYELHSRILELGYTGLKQIVEENDLPPLERLRSAIWWHTKTMISNAWLTKVFVRTADLQNLPSRLRRRIRNLRRGYVAIFEGLIQEAARAGGSLGSVDPKLMSFVIIDAINWIPQWYREGGNLSPDELADILSDFFMAGLCHFRDEGSLSKSPWLPATAGGDNEVLTKGKTAL